MLVEFGTMEQAKDDGMCQQSLLLGADVERGFTVSFECSVQVGVVPISPFGFHKLQIDTSLHISKH